MRRRKHWLLLPILGLILPAGMAAGSPGIGGPSLGGLTLGFEENRGQLPDGVRFGARGERFRLLLSPASGTLLSQNGRGVSKVRRHIDLRIVGANPAPEIVGENQLAGRLHYVSGADPASWVQNVRRFAQVRYREVLPGIDLVYHERQLQLEYDFVVW